MSCGVVAALRELWPVDAFAWQRVRKEAHPPSIHPSNRSCRLEEDICVASDTSELGAGSVLGTGKLHHLSLQCLVLSRKWRVDRVLNTCLAHWNMQCFVVIVPQSACMLRRCIIFISHT